MNAPLDIIGIFGGEPPPAPCGCGAERCDCDETPPLCSLCDDLTELEDGSACPACCGDLYAVEACAECERALATHERASRPLCDACGGVMARVPVGAMGCPW